MTITATETPRRTLLGYPSRPTGGIIGTKLPDDFKLLSGEIATPKLDGHRVLMDLASGLVFNRHKEPYSYMDEDDRLKIWNHLKILEDVDWVDMEYLPYDVDKGKAVILDVIPAPYCSTYCYADRRRLYAWGFEDCSHRLCSGDKHYGYRLRGIREYFGQSGFVGALYDKPVFTMPWAGSTERARKMWVQLTDDWESRGMPSKHLWEGIVVKDATTHYKFTHRQSMNMDMETKYRFR
jgi:hypothetical protein